MKIHKYFFNGQLKTRWMIFEDNQFMSKDISHIKSFNIPISVGCTALIDAKWV